jgi:hypothetical protein
MMTGGVRVIAEGTRWQPIGRIIIPLAVRRRAPKRAKKAEKRGEQQNTTQYGHGDMHCQLPRA